MAEHKTPEAAKNPKKVRTQSNVSLVEDLPTFRICDPSLTMQEKMFVCAYCANGFNAAGAYKQTHPDCKDDLKAARIGYEIKSRPAVQHAIKDYLSATLDEYKESLHYEIIKTNIARAFYDVSDYYTDKGDLKPLSKMTKEQRLCIDGVKHTTAAKPTYILANKDKALEVLIKYMNIIKPEAGGESGLDIKVIQDLAHKTVEVKILRREERETLVHAADWVEQGKRDEEENENVMGRG